MPRLLRRIAGAVLLLAALGLLLDRVFPLPLARLTEPGSVLVLARDGTPLRAFADARGVWRYRVRLDDIAPVYLSALLHYEDRWFFRHPGVNPASLLRALTQAVLSGRVISGGSTLTMQVARLLEPIPRTPLGKCRQALRALQLEWHFSKHDILEMYVNLAPFGGAIEGVQAASHAYLGKSAAELSDAEAALLVVLPQAPTRWRPDRHAARAQQARDKVIARLQQLGVFSPARAADARMEQVAARRLRAPMRAPLLAQRVRARDEVVRTSIDAEIQARVEARVRAYLRRLPPRSSVAALVVEHAGMEARAYVGSADLLDGPRSGHVDMVRAPRSPGSTLKPFLYGMALDQGLIHSASLLVDAPQSFDGYQPSNFMEHYQGPVSATQALRQSLNVPAVDLLERVGVVRFTAALENAGIRLRMAEGARPNLALILGGAATSLEELVGGYAALARGGRAAQVRLRATDPLQERHLLSPGAAWLVRRMLERAPNDSYAVQQFDSASRVSLAWKTGTSYGFRDSWALAVTPEFVVGIWIGRPDGTPLPGQYGAVTALPLLVETVDSLPNQKLRFLDAPPASVSELPICWPLGGAQADTPADLCHRTLDAVILNGTVPPTFADRDAAIWHAGRLQYWQDPRSGARRNLSCLRPDSRLVTIARWPALAYPWLRGSVKRQSALPALAPDCAADEYSTGLRIAGISDGGIVRNPGRQLGALTIEVQALGSDGAIHWLLDDRLVAQSRGDQRIRIRLEQDGDHVLIAIDPAGSSDRVTLRAIGTGNGTQAALRGKPSSAATPGLYTE